MSKAEQKGIPITESLTYEELQRQVVINLGTTKAGIPPLPEPSSGDSSIINSTSRVNFGLINLISKRGDNLPTNSK